MNRATVLSLMTAAVVLVALAFARHAPTAQAAPDAPTYVSYKTCKGCHFKEYKSWKKTVHAKAMDVLKPGAAADVKTAHKLDPNKDYSQDPACVKCHTTGYGQPGGYPEIKASWSDDEKKLAEENAGVGCEMCHGAGSKYAAFKKEDDNGQNYKRAQLADLGMNVPLTADACKKCHNDESPTFDASKFDFEAMKKNKDAIHEHYPLKHEH